MEDIDKVLAYEIKKEIADRYFTFRKLIEVDSAAYLDAVLAATVQFEAHIGLDLIRLYILLKDPELIRRFQQMLTIEHDLFYDPYICSSSTIRQRLFAGQCMDGLTRKARYKKLFFTTYERLQAHSITYKKTCDELMEEHDVITKQITLFYRKNDLSYILPFIRSLDQSTQPSAMLEGARDDGFASSMEKKMLLTPPDDAQTLLPHLPVLPPLKAIKKELLVLIDRALRNQPRLDVRMFCHP